MKAPTSENDLSHGPGPKLRFILDIQYEHENKSWQTVGKGFEIYLKI